MSVELKLNLKKIKLTLGDHNCEIREPTLREWHALHEESKVSGKDGTEIPVDKMENFLISLGMTKEIAVMLTPTHLEQIIEEIRPAKKK